MFKQICELCQKPKDVCSICHANERFCFEVEKSEVYQQGRADAIDEFAKRLKSFDIAFTYVDKADEFRKAIDNFAEQIKEQSE